MSKVEIAKMTAIGVFVIIIIAGLFGMPFLNVSTKTINVNSVENVVTSESSRYLVFSDEGVFENTDCMMRGKFDSSDFHNKLGANGEFTVRVYGFRVPFLSMYQNIFEIQ